MTKDFNEYTDDELRVVLKITNALANMSQPQDEMSEDEMLADAERQARDYAARRRENRRPEIGYGDEILEGDTLPLRERLRMWRRQTNRVK